jgi:GDP-L-fucose synthase
MKQNRILITGASGFIGRNLTEYFSVNGRRVFPVDLPEFDLLNESAVRSFFGKISPDVVIHCANVGGTRGTELNKSAADNALARNLRMFFNLARCLKPGMRMITMGSGAEYDKRRPLRKVSEKNFDAQAPADDYGYAKYVMSKYIEKTDNIACLRIFGLYGKYEDYTFKFISNAILKNLLGLPIVINQNVRFDFLHINDFVAIVEKFLARKPKYSHYNATPSRSIDLVTIAKIINGIAEKKSAIRVLNPGLNREYTGANARLLKEFPGFKFTSYEKGIAELYSYYSRNLKFLDLDSVRKDPYLKLCSLK